MRPELDPTHPHYYDKDYFDPDPQSSAPRKSSYRKGYSENSLWPIRFNLAATHIFWECLLGETIRNKTVNILDLGGAKGILTKRLARFPGVKAVNLDFSGYATQNTVYRQATVCGDIRFMPFSSHSFDVLVSVDVLEHLPPNDVGRFLAEAKRVLRPQGKAFFVVAVKNEPFAQKDKSHLTLDDRNWWEREFQKGGFLLQNHLSVKIARRLGGFHPFGKVPIPTFREGLFVLARS